MGWCNEFDDIKDEKRFVYHASLRNAVIIPLHHDLRHMYIVTQRPYMLIHNKCGPRKRWFQTDDQRYEKSYQDVILQYIFIDILYCSTNNREIAVMQKRQL